MSAPPPHVSSDGAPPPGWPPGAEWPRADGAAPPPTRGRRVGRVVAIALGVFMLAVGLLMVGLMAVAYVDYRQALEDGALEVRGRVGECTRYEISGGEGTRYGLECTYTWDREGRTGTTVVRDSVQEAPEYRDLLVVPETGEDVWDPRIWMWFMIPIGLFAMAVGVLLISRVERGGAPVVPPSP